MLEEKLDLQLFADDEEEQEEEELEEEEFDEEEEGEEEPEEEEQGNVVQMTQEELDQIVEKRLARERKKQEKQLAELFGTQNLEEAAQYYKVGHEVSQAAKKTPQEVLQRLAQQRGGQQTQGQQQPAAVDNELRQKLERLETLFLSEKEQEQQQQQLKEAREEFGTYFDQHRDEIEDMAEERGLSLADAAAVVLRPKLGDIAEQRSQKKSKQRRRKAADTSDGKPASKQSVSGKLTAEQKRTAQKMGLSYSKYYEQLKALGRIEE